MGNPPVTHKDLKEIKSFAAKSIKELESRVKVLERQNAKMASTIDKITAALSRVDPGRTNKIDQRLTEAEKLVKFLLKEKAGKRVEELAKVIYRLEKTTKDDSLPDGVANKLLGKLNKQVVDSVEKKVAKSVFPQLKQKERDLKELDTKLFKLINDVRMFGPPPKKGEDLVSIRNKYWSLHKEVEKMQRDARSYTSNEISRVKGSFETTQGRFRDDIKAERKARQEALKQEEKQRKQQTAQFKSQIAAQKKEHEKQVKAAMKQTQDYIIDTRIKILENNFAALAGQFAKK